MPLIMSVVRFNPGYLTQFLAGIEVLSIPGNRERLRVHLEVGKEIVK
jgi:hypothetical protein